MSPDAALEYALKAEHHAFNAKARNDAAAARLWLRLRDKWLVKAEELERSHDPH